MIDQRHCRLDRADGGNAERRTALDHDDLDAERTRSSDLRISGAATGILGDDDLDALVVQQLPFVGFVEGTACEDVTAVGNGKRRVDRINAADKIAVLRSSGEAPGLLSADGEEDTAGRGTERRDGGVDAVDASPSVTIDNLPGRATQRKEWNLHSFSGGRRVGRDLVGERMGRVDEQVDTFLSQVINQALGATEAADAGRQGQGLGIRGSPGKRNRRVDIVAQRQSFRQRACLGRATEDQDTVLAHG